MVCTDVGASRFDDEREIEDMRSNDSAFGSVLLAMDDDRGRDRVLRVGFWTNSPSHEGATPIALDAIRNARTNRAR